jgi:hypothetical protein
MLKLCLREFDTLTPSESSQAAPESSGQHCIDWQDWSMDVKVDLDAIELSKGPPVITSHVQSPKTPVRASDSRRIVTSMKRSPWRN